MKRLYGDQLIQAYKQFAENSPPALTSQYTLATYNTACITTNKMVSFITDLASRCEVLLLQECRPHLHSLLQQQLDSDLTITKAPAGQDLFCCVIYRHLDNKPALHYFRESGSARHYWLFTWMGNKVLGTHLEMLPDIKEAYNYRLRQIREILEINPDVIMGDLNFNEYEPEFGLIIENGYLTPWLRNSHTTPYNTTVDWIFSKKYLGEQQVGATLSDHRPVAIIAPIPN